MTYRIKYHDGQTETGIENYDVATERILTVYPDAVIGHSGDLTDGGDRTLCWASEEDAGPEGAGDDGLRACASIIME